jgi:Nucleoside-diphosphate-sugar pyrophosphorylase involved in lipopolysaccharide biosynthesis/translation initiation factor 2B, gamma/epsilon subunits (eIF-2Bgamma/eIF-2Bepsilon)
MVNLVKFTIISVNFVNLNIERCTMQAVIMAGGFGTRLRPITC